MNKNEAFLDPMFSKPLYSKILNIDTKKIISMYDSGNHDTKFHDADSYSDMRKRRRYEESNTAQSPDCLYVLEEKRFKFLKDELMKAFYSFASDVMRYSNKFEITTSWFTKSIPGQSSSSHNHDNCMYSAVLYLQTSENCGNILFKSFANKRYYLVKNDYNLYNSTEWEVKPVDGLLVIFPSEIYHQILENKSDTTRYSLAFNLAPTGVIGNSYTDSHLKIKVEK